MMRIPNQKSKNLFGSISFIILIFFPIRKKELYFLNHLCLFYITRKLLLQFQFFIFTCHFGDQEIQQHNWQKNTVDYINEPLSPVEIISFKINFSLHRVKLRISQTSPTIILSIRLNENDRHRHNKRSNYQKKRTRCYCDGNEHVNDISEIFENTQIGKSSEITKS